MNHKQLREKDYFKKPQYLRGKNIEKLSFQIVRKTPDFNPSTC